MKKLLSQVLIFACVFTVALGLGLTPVQAQDTVKGGQKLVQAKQLKSAADVLNLKEGDLVVSSCPHCKTMNYKRVDSSVRGGKIAATKDSAICPACDVKMAAEQAKHVCKMCGGEMICCVIPSDRAAAK